MNRFHIFRKMMNLLAEIGSVTDANMKDYLGRMTFKAKSGSQIIEVEIEIKEAPDAKEV